MKKYSKSIRKEAIKVEESVNFNLKDFVKKVHNGSLFSEFNKDDLSALYRLLNDLKILHKIGFKEISGTRDDAIFVKLKYPNNCKYIGSTIEDFDENSSYDKYAIDEAIELLPKIGIINDEGNISLSLLYFINDFFVKNPSYILDAISSIDNISNFYTSFLPAKYLDLKKHFEAKKGLGMTIEWFIAWQKSYAIKGDEMGYGTDKQFEEDMILLNLLSDDYKCDAEMIEYLLEAERNGEIELRVNSVDRDYAINKLFDALKN